MRARAEDAHVRGRVRRHRGGKDEGARRPSGAVRRVAADVRHAGGVAGKAPASAHANAAPEPAPVTATGTKVRAPRDADRLGACAGATHESVSRASAANRPAAGPTEPKTQPRCADAAAGAESRASTAAPPPADTASGATRETDVGAATAREAPSSP